MGSISDATTIRKRKFRRREYHRLGEVGPLDEDDRVELIEGELLELAPITGEHAVVVPCFQWPLHDNAIRRSLCMCKIHSGSIALPSHSRIWFWRA